MKIKFGLKIVLLICSIIIVGLLSAGLFTLVFVENQKFEYSMLLLYAVVMSGILSIVYHIKTLKYYKKQQVFEVLNGTLFWIGNLLFSMALFCFSIYAMYSFYLIYESLDTSMNSDYVIFFIICLFILLLGVFLAVEESKLYKYIQNYEEQQFVDSIDDIKGQQGGGAE